MNNRDLSDAVAERALARAGGGLAAVGVLMGVMASAVLLLADGPLDASSLPPVVLLSSGQVLALMAAAACLVRLRAVRRRPGTGPRAAAAAADLLDRVVVGVPVLGLALAVACVALVTPRAGAAFSALVAFAVLGQLPVAALALRRGLRRSSRQAH